MLINRVRNKYNLFTEMSRGLTEKLLFSGILNYFSKEKSMNKSIDSCTVAYRPVHSPPWTKTKGYAPILIWTVGPDPTAEGAWGGRRWRTTAVRSGAPWPLAGARPNGGAVHAFERKKAGEREEGEPCSPKVSERVGVPGTSGR